MTLKTDLTISLLVVPSVLLGCSEESTSPSLTSDAGVVDGAADGPVDADSGTHTPVDYDFDGDGRADHALFVDDDGSILVNRSATDEQWTFTVEGAAVGDPDWLPTVADYDGDGRADFSWYEPTTGRWQVFESSKDFALREPVAVLGDVGDLPRPADFDGDGRADYALHRVATGQLAVLDSSSTEPWFFEQGGVAVGEATWLAAAADYDGDGKADPAWFDPTTQTWRVFDSSLGYAERPPLTMGSSRSVPLPADYDGDGKADRALFDTTTGTIMVHKSTDDLDWSLKVDDSPIGKPRWLPAIADYDGDGRADLSWFLPDTQRWRTYESSQDFAEHELIEIGAQQDVPVATPPELTKEGRVVVVVGSPKSPGSTGGTRGVTIAIDSINQPHIIGERQGSGLDSYHRIGGSWTVHEPLTNPAGALGSPHLEIDQKDRGWLSFTTFVSGDTNATGEWVSLIGDMVDQPSSLWSERVVPYTGFSGYLALDPHYPDNCWRMGGQPHPTYKFDDQGSFVEGKTLSPGASSETIGFRIHSREGGGKPGVWHAAHSVIYQSHRCSYVNSAMAEPVVWDSAWREGDSDYTRAYIGLDYWDREIAYLSTYHDGVVLNIWTGTDLMYPADQIHVVAPASEVATLGNGATRFGAQWTEAARGGAFLCWTSADHRVKLKHIQLVDGSVVFGDTVDIGPGQQCAMATDHRGNLHLAYVEGSMKYRKIRTR
jgi:hypothetical protein